MTKRDHQTEIEELKMKVSLLNREHETLTNHNNRLDQVIEQIKDLTSGISTMISIQEEKHVQHFKEEQRLSQMIDLKEQRLDDDIQKIEDKLDLFSETVHKRITDSENKIISKLDTLAEKRDIKLDDVLQNRDNKRDKLEDRIRKVEIKVYVAIGGAVVVGFVLKIAISLLT